MAQPTPYNRLYNFGAYARNNPAAPYQPYYLDAELDAIETSIDETIANLALLQRDDGALRNAIVTPDSLSTETLNLIGSWNPTGVWITATSYAKLDMVSILATDTTYVCAVAHVSGSFAADLASGYWQPVNSPTSGASSVQFTTNNVLLGRATAGAGGGEEIPCTTFARSLLDDSTAAAACITLGLGSTSDPTFSDVTVDTLTVTGFTASSMVYASAAKGLTATAAPTDGQLLIGSTGAIPALGTLTGTANQITVTNAAGSITLSLPQSIALTSTPSFAGLTLTGLSQGSIVFVGSSSVLAQDNSHLFWNDLVNELTVTGNVGIGSDPTDVPNIGNPVLGANNLILYNVGNVGLTLLTDIAAPRSAQIGFGAETVFQFAAGMKWTTAAGDLDLWAGGAVRLTVGVAGAITATGAVKATYYATSAPVTETNATHTVAATTAYLICNRAGAITVTLPAAASFTGRQITISTIQAQQVDSNAANVVLRTGGAAGTVILPNTDGAWTKLVSDGTNWIAMEGNA